jgi:predicted type IV restriction endonuclease
MTTGDDNVVIPETQHIVQEQPKVPITRRPRGEPKPLPKWEADAKERIKTAIRRYASPLQQMLDRDANEGDTRLFVTDFLCEALGFDKFNDLTTEYRVKGDFADYGIRMDKQLVAFIEVKRITTKLDSRHLKQVEMYAVNEGVEWVILTNGINWKVYHITGGLPMIIDIVLDVSLLGDESPQKKSDKLFYITKEALKHDQIDELWKAQRATSPKAFANAILAPSVVDALQREIKRQTQHRIDADEVIRLLKSTILRPECLEKEGGK